MSRRKPTPAYLFFYILFHPDSWRILIGIIAALFLNPFVVRPGMTAGGRMILFLMLTVIGYAVSGWPARRITVSLKKLILGDRR